MPTAISAATDRVAGGVFKVGDDVVALPSGLSSKVTSIAIGETSVDKAFPPQSVVMTLEDDIDLSRGQHAGLGEQPAR